MAKVTIKEQFNALLDDLHDKGINSYDEFIAERIAAIDKKKSSNTKAKQETLERAEKVYAALAEMEKPVTLSELKDLTSDAEVADYHTSRLSALVRKLGDRVKREEIKGKAYFSVA